MAVVQPLERTRDVDVELKVILVLGLVDPLEVPDNVLLDLGSEWFRGVDLIVGRRVEIEGPITSCDDLIIGEEVNTDGERDKEGHHHHPRWPFRLGRPGKKKSKREHQKGRPIFGRQ